ncbi:hypothetical protein M885DRAFT_63583 [Pelagophyceae sp. CCMP2097]|nr:hypothetical protein M885DRAFT_63583 [Pelagophyceae sp. CCMP2097]
MRAPDSESSTAVSHEAMLRSRLGDIYGPSRRRTRPCKGPVSRPSRGRIGPHRGRLKGTSTLGPSRGRRGAASDRLGAVEGPHRAETRGRIGSSPPPPNRRLSAKFQRRRLDAYLVQDPMNLKSSAGTRHEPALAQIENPETPSLLPPLPGVRKYGPLRGHFSGHLAGLCAVT